MVDALPPALVTVLVTDNTAPVPLVTAKVIGTPLRALIVPDFGPIEVTPVGGVICTVSGSGRRVDTGPDWPLPLALPSVTVTADAVKFCVKLPLKAEARIVATPDVFPKVSEIWPSPVALVKLLVPDKVAGPESTLHEIV